MGNTLSSFAYERETVLYYGVGTYVVLLGSWVCSCAPFLALDKWHLLDDYRIQRAPSGGPAPAAASTRAISLARSMVALNWSWLLPAVLGASPLMRRLFPRDAPAPPAWQAPFLAYLWFLMHDVSFYCYHRTLHEVPWLYKRFHKPHHTFTAPFAWSSHAVHPVEMMLQSVGGLSGPLTWSALFGLPIHVLWAWLALMQTQGVMDHSGFAFPWPFDVFAAVPGFGGTQFHDDHHKYFNCNYAATFSAIDKVMGTSRAQRGYK